MLTAAALALTCLTTLSGSPSAAVSPLQTALQIPSRANRPVLYDRPGDGKLWAVGANWKASFGEAGVTYFPILGADAPATSARFTLTGASVAGLDLALEDVDSITRIGDSVTLDRGVLRETWNLARTEIEQTFVFDEIPVGGAIELDVTLTTDLEKRDAGDALALESHAAAVRYGAAIAFDSAGKTVHVERIATEHGFKLRVPSAFAADAVMPLTVDPIVTHLGPIAPSNEVQRNPGAAFGLAIPGSGTTSEYLVVWEELANGGDIDLFSVALDIDGGVVPNSMAIVDATNEAWFRPSIAYHRHSQSFLVVATTRMAGGSSNVRGRRRRLTTGFLGPILNIAAPSFIEAENPEVGGFDVVPGGSDNHFTVVWEQESGNGDSDVWGRRVRGDGTIAGPAFAIATGPEDDVRPSISKGAGAPFFGEYWHNIVWHRDPLGPSPKIYCRRSTTTGNSMTGEFLAGFGSYQHRGTVSETLREPVLNDGSLPFVVTYRRDDSVLDGLYAVIAGNSGRISGTNVAGREGFATPLVARAPVVVHTGGGVTLAYAAFENGGYALRATSMGVARNAPLSNTPFLGAGERGLEVTGTINGASQFDVASIANGGSIQDDGLFVWNELGVLHASTFEGPASLGSPILGLQYCESNPNSTGERGWISGRGAPEVVSQKRILAESLPPGVFGFMVVGSSPGSSTPAGSDGKICIGGTIGRYTNMIQQATAAGTMEFSFFPFNIPQGGSTVAAAAGDTFYFQVWHRDVNGGGATSNLTNALLVSFE